MDHKVLLDRLGQLEYKVYLGHQVTRDRRETLEIVVSLVPLAPLARLDNKGAREDLVFLDQLDLMDFKERKVNPDNLGYLDQLARMVFM